MKSNLILPLNAIEIKDRDCEQILGGHHSYDDGMTLKLIINSLTDFIIDGEEQYFGLEYFTKRKNSNFFTSSNQNITSLDKNKK